MLHRNLPRSRPKRNAAPVSRVTWKEKKIMSNAILAETEQIWKDLTWNVKVPEKDNFWTRITSNMIVPEKEKIGTDFTSNVKVPEEENYWKEIASNMMVPEKTNLKTVHHIKCESSWIGTFLKRNHIIYDIGLGKGKKSLGHAMSICRCDSMWWQPLFGISGAWLAFFSPQSSRRSAIRKGTQLERDWNSRVHHSSSRIQELSSGIHVPCYGHTGHTQYVSFFTGPSWWRYWETSRILCMMLSPWKTGHSLGIMIPFYLKKLICLQPPPTN